MTQLDAEVTKRIIRLVIEDGRSQQSVADEYGLSSSVVRRVIKNYRKACQVNFDEAEKLKLMEENKRLQEENAELKKEAEFLKKAAAFFAKDVH